MVDNSREKLIKEYEMLIEKSMEKIEEEQVKLVNDDIKAKELTVLYVKALKNYIRNDYEEGEKAVNKYLEKIIEMKNIQEEEHIETIKSNTCEMIKQGIIRIDEPIKKYFECKSYYDDILEDTDCLEKEWVEINTEKEKLTNKELDIFNSFIGKISNKINSEITKIEGKSMSKSVLKNVALRVGSVVGIYLVKKVAKDTALKYVKSIFEKMLENETDKKKEGIKETLKCINNAESLTKNM